MYIPIHADATITAAASKTTPELSRCFPIKVKSIYCIFTAWTDKSDGQLGFGTIPESLLFTMTLPENHYYYFLDIFLIKRSFL